MSLEDIVFVSWNVHVGNGDLNAFVRDLRTGVLTDGKPVRHFVLMLQEAVRGREVPAYAAGASSARRIAARAKHAIDIVDISRDLELSLIYVPSMRNGHSSHFEATDRGSAILSTLPFPIRLLSSCLGNARGGSQFLRSCCCRRTPRR